MTVSELETRVSNKWNMDVSTILFVTIFYTRYQTWSSNMSSNMNECQKKSAHPKNMRADNQGHKTTQLMPLLQHRLKVPNHQGKQFQGHREHDASTSLIGSTLCQ